MDRSCRSKCALAFGAVLVCAGCSFSDFNYLSNDFGKGGTSAGGSAGSGGSGATAGSGAASGGAGAGMGGQAGSEPTAGGGVAGTGVAEFYCEPKHAVFARATGGEPPPVALPANGNYILHKHSSATDCLITPDWPELGDKQYFAITHDCGGPGSPNPPGPGEVWHLEHLCSDAYRVTAHHDTPNERQLGILDQTMVGTPLYSVASQRSLDPFFVFQLRFEEVVGQMVRWRFSPAIMASSCAEQSGTMRYGELDVTRVVHYPCTGNALNQSWNLLPVP